MKTKFKHRMVAMTLAVMMTAAPVWGAAHAADEAIGSQPEMPVAESYMDNDKIEEYNKQVDSYNASAKEHNELVDKDYEAAVSETEKRNAEIDQHNAAELERVRAAEERNAQAVKDAEEANAKIDEENEAEEARIKEHNDNEDAKAKASEDARKAAEEENDAIRAHNESVAKYAEDKVQYDADYAQYQKDLAMEQRIKAAGYTSVEHYNNTINKNYNEPALASVERNATANKVSAKDTYAVEEAAEKSGAKVNVHIEHVFEGTDVSYIEDFDIDRNDVITINSIAALGNATEPGYASLYYSTDDAHQMGYWVPYVELQYNARYMNSNWNCGSSYEVSYKDGKNHKYDSEDIIAIYTYTWIPQKTYKTYNVPVAPEELVNPGEAKELVEVPELYTPSYQTFVQKQHIEAELEEIEEANILERIEGPVKRDYIALLAYMSLFNEPVAAEEVIPAAKAAAEPAKAAKAVIPAASAQAETVQASTAAAETLEAEAAPAVMIADEAVPMAGVQEEGPIWALLNLIMALITGLIFAVLMAGYFGRDESEDEADEEKTNRKGFVRIMSVIPAVGALIAFILTENMSNPMALTDRWTILMAAILLIQAVVALIAKKSEDKKDDDDMAEAANA